MFRDDFCLAPEKTEPLARDEDRLKKLKEIHAEVISYRFDEILQPPESAHKGSVFDLMAYFQGKGATSLVRCLKNGDDGDVNFQVVNPVASLKGKYVMVVCSFVPTKWSDYNAERLCRLWVLSKEIASNDKFEIVIVAKMRNKYETNMAAFQHFLSGFPNRLAISLDHPDLRDDFCYNLGFNGVLKGILIDPNGKTVQDDLSFIDKYGASAFHFTDDSLEAVTNENMSLTSLLRCDSSARLYKFGFPSESMTVEQISKKPRLYKFGFPSESITVEQISKKLVGLYLFRLGDKLDRFYEVYRLCQLRDKSKDVEPQFQIVLFCLPGGAIDPATFQLDVYEFLNLKPDIDVSSWWVCNYDNSAGLRLSTVMSMLSSRQLDATVTIGPNGEFIDFYGGQLVCNLGHWAYPFSTEALVQRYVKLANQILLSSLFTTYVNELVKQDGSRIDVKELQFKNVLLYVDSIPSSAHSTLDNLIRWYPKIKQHDPDVEVVFVSYTPSELGSVSPPESESEIPWIVCPYHPQVSASLRHHSLFYGHFDGKGFMQGLRPASVVAFGKGGHIHLLNATSYLLDEGPDSNPFSPRSKDLRGEIFRQMQCDRLHEEQ